MTNSKTENKIFELIKKPITAVFISFLVLVWTFVKDTFKTGAEVKFRIEVTEIVKADLKNYYDSVIDQRFIYNLDKALNNPVIWFDALNTPFVNEFAEEKAEDLRQEVKRKLIEIDSLQGDFIQTLGRKLGIRDEDILPLFEKMMLKHIKDTEPHRLTVPF